MNHDHHHMNHEQHNHIQQQSPGPAYSVNTTNSPIIMADDDHSGHNPGEDASSNHTQHSMMMSMFFHGGYKETILFEFWKTTDVWGLLGSVVFIFFLAFAYEALKFYREHLYRRSFRAVQYNTVTVPVENGGAVKETHKTVQVKMFSALHTWQTVLHVVQTIISYFLMLIFMTYNIWLCLAVALGAGVGYFFFGWKKSLVVDITEHCH